MVLLFQISNEINCKLQFVVELEPETHNECIMSFIERFPSFAGKTFSPNISGGIHSQCTSVRIVQCDFTMAPPQINWDVVYSDFNQQQTFQVPVIRIFGPEAKSGRKVCAHIHGVLPYFYVALNPNVIPNDDFVRAFAESCERALRSSSRAQNRRSIKGGFVHNIEVVAGIPIYGYYECEQEFLKIFMYNPTHIGWLADILVHGAIMGAVFQPYESHIPFIMQFFQDFNLYGMNLIHLSEVRNRVEKQSENADPVEGKSMLLEKVTDLEKVSICELEFDAISSCILNKSLGDTNPTGSQKRLANPGLRSIWQDEFQRQALVSHSQRVDIANPESPERTSVPEPFSQFNELNEIFEALGDFEMSQTLTLKPFATPQTKDGSSSRLETPSKLDFEAGKAKASSTPFHTNFKWETDVQKTPGSLSEVDVPGLPLKNNESFIDEEIIQSLSSQNKLDAENEMNSSFSSLRNALVANATQRNLSGSVTNQSGIDLTKLDEADEEIVDVIDKITEGQELTWSEKIFFDEKLDFVEDRNLSQVISFSPIDEEQNEEEFEDNKDNNGRVGEFVQGVQADDQDLFDLPKLSQLDGKNGFHNRLISTRHRRNPETVKDSSSEVKLREMKPCVVLVDRLSPSLYHQHMELRNSAFERVVEDEFETDDKCSSKTNRGQDIELAVNKARSRSVAEMEPLTVDTSSNQTPSKDDQFVTPAVRVKSAKKCKVDLPCFEVSSLKKLKPCIALNDNYENLAARCSIDLQNQFSNASESKHSESYLFDSDVSISDDSPVSLSQDLERSKRPSDVSVNCLFRSSNDINAGVTEPGFVNRSDDFDDSDGSDDHFVRRPGLATDPKASEKLSRKNDDGGRYQIDDFNYEPAVSEKSHPTESSTKIRNGNPIPHAELNSQLEQPVTDSSYASSSVADHVRVVRTSSISQCTTQELPRTTQELPKESDTISSSPSGSKVDVVCNDLESNVSTATTKSLESCNGSERAGNIDDDLNEMCSNGGKSLINNSQSSIILVAKEDIVEADCQYEFAEDQNAIVGDQYVSETSMINVIDQEADVVMNASAGEVNYRMLAEDLAGQGPKLRLLFDDETQLQTSPELFSSPEYDDNLVTKLTFAKLPPTRSYVMQNLEKEGLVEVDYTHDDRLSFEVEPFHRETVSDSFGGHFIDGPIGRKITLTPALPPPKLSPSKMKMFEESNLQLAIDGDSGQQLNCNDSPQTSRSNARPSSPSMFYSFMAPIIEVEQDQANVAEKNSCVECERFGTDVRGNDTSGLKPDLNNFVNTPFARRHSTTGISIHEAQNSPIIADKLNQLGHDPSSSQGHRYQHLTVMSMELHIVTRSSLLPNPVLDHIVTILYSILDDSESGRNKIDSGVLMLRPENSEGASNRLRQLCLERNIEIKFCISEVELIIEFSQFVAQLDPDVLLGYEVQNSSWGYLLKRGTALEIDMMAPMFSRIQSSKESHFDKDRDAFGADDMSEINLVGRVVLNVWRIMKSELNLRSFDFHVVYQEVLKRRLPVFSYKSLTSWFNPLDTKFDAKMSYKVIDHLITRCKGSIEILSKLDLITRTSEMSRLFGILFFEVLTRGTQFRVESMLIRSAKSRNFIAASPSIQQRAKMRAPEHIPLVLEPESAFYADPVLVLDFQSLYPSMMIAYNYCYSTCIGRVEHLKDETNSVFQLGTLPYFVPASHVKKLIKKQKVHVAPNGVAYVDTSIRKGLICQMVEDILNTRIMVKRFMKNYKNDPVLYKMLDARQLGLKLIANTTYGYTGASFSGRMPCVEIADSIVRKARETLEKSIDFVNSNPKWNAEVVYGDTDSMFVRLPGASKETAFKIGHEIGEMITQMNPKPVKLKFEKVYHPCVLITKKRYVGYSYESLDQKEPLFDAKGIETVRRDNCPVVGKIMEKSLRLLFETKDLSVVKEYVQRQLTKITHGRVPLNDFVFAKEFRGRDRYKPGAHIAALKIADKQLSTDPIAEPLRGDRVPYCIVYGVPKLPLYQLIRSPHELVKNPMLRINALYYIVKQVLPPLDRIFGLIDRTDVFKWYNDLPVYANQLGAVGFSTSKKSKKSSTLAMFVSTKTCASCFQRQCNVQSPVCDECLKNPQNLLWKLSLDVRENQSLIDGLRRICLACSGHMRYSNDCSNFDCQVFQKLLLTKRILPDQVETLSRVETKLSN